MNNASLLIYVGAIISCFFLVFYFFNWLITSRKITWVHWIWASPIIIPCNIIIWLAKIIKLIKPIGKVPGYQIEIDIYQPNQWLLKQWDLLPDGKIGGDTIWGQCAGTKILVGHPDALETIRHETRHTYQMFRWGLLFLLLYGWWFLTGFLSEIFDGKELKEAINNAYLKIPFEVAARKYEKIPFKEW